MPDKISLGVYGWGIVVPAFCAFILYHIFTGDPTDPTGAYVRIKECASIIAAIIAAGALGWSWFYQTAGDQDKTSKKLDEIIEKLTPKN